MLLSDRLRFTLGSSAALVAALCASCSSSPKSEVVVSVKDQRLGVYEAGHLVKAYPISTSKFGVGDSPNSYCTPLGKHEVIAKIGHGLPKGAVLKSRSWNGEVLKPNAPGRDPIVSRILWLRGMEKSNKNAQSRFIYIHGTTEENKLGKPASFGCVRMGMSDVVEVFEEVSIGAKVVITKGSLPHGAKAPAEAPEAAPASAPETLVADAGKPAAAKAGEPAPGLITAPVPVDDADLKATTGKHKKGKENATASASSPAVASGAPPKAAAKGKKAKTSSAANAQIKIGPEVPSLEEIAAKKDPERASKGFFSLKNKWPLRRSEKTESPS